MDPPHPAASSPSITHLTLLQPLPPRLVVLAPFLLLLLFHLFLHLGGLEAHHLVNPLCDEPRLDQSLLLYVDGTAEWGPLSDSLTQ